jgi:phosphatidylglycerophosphatase C
LTLSTDSRLVVFDLDGVIARTDTMAFLIQRQLSSHPLRAMAGAFPAVAWFALHRYPRLRVRLSRALGRAALSGLSADEYRELAVEVGSVLGRDPARNIPNGVAAVKRHLLAGDEVVVTTGTEATLSRTFLDALGLSDVGLIATTIRFDSWIVRYENHNLGRDKVRGFVDRKIDVFYTDSDLDLPVARLSRHSVLVNPSPRLTSLFRSQIASLEIVRWE